MNTKYVLAAVMAFGLAGTAYAQNSLLRPDFVIPVPLNLQGMPGEIFEVLVWCDVMNATYNGPRGKPSALANDEGNIAYVQMLYGAPPPLTDNSSNGQPLVIARGGIKIGISDREMCGVSAAGGAGARVAGPPCPGQPRYKPPAYWSVGKIFGAQSSNLVSEIRAIPSAKPGPNDVTTPDIFGIEEFGRPDVLPKSLGPGATGPAGPRDTNKIVTVRAWSDGLTDSSYGTAYACHIGFTADVEFEGRREQISIFTGPTGRGTMNSLPLLNPPERTTLHVYGATGVPAPKPKPKP